MVTIFRLCNGGYYVYFFPDFGRVFEKESAILAALRLARRRRFGRVRATLMGWMRPGLAGWLWVGGGSDGDAVGDKKWREVEVNGGGSPLVGGGGNVYW